MPFRNPLPTILFQVHAGAPDLRLKLALMGLVTPRGDDEGRPYDLLPAFSGQGGQSRRLLLSVLIWIWTGWGKTRHYPR